MYRWRLFLVVVGAPVFSLFLPIYLPKAFACIPTISKKTFYTVHVMGAQDLNIIVGSTETAYLEIKINKNELKLNKIPYTQGNSGMLSLVEIKESDDEVYFIFQVLTTGRAIISLDTLSGKYFQPLIAQVASPYRCQNE